MTQSPSRRAAALRILGGVALLAGGALWPWQAAQAQFRVEIAGVGATQIPIAIGTFRDEARVPQPVSRIIKADLERSGLFR
ncbi:MAG: Tol-Pal system protein TolB, partial [Aquabacterium sp.]|nr:Tol-Pal system protein TolB [Aquabacterium sp.]